MGEFSYICPKCGRAINGYEVVHFRHIRHGKVLGETVGHNDGYGGVSQLINSAVPFDPYYRIWKSKTPSADYPNTHEDICESEFKLLDSIDYDAKIYEGKPYDWMELREKFGYTLDKGTPPESFYELWAKLPKYVPEKIASGTSAYHEYCYRRLSDEEKAKNIISELDPNQGWGRELKKYVEVE